MQKNNKYNNQTKPDFSFLADNWPSLLVTRKDVGKFTGGVVHPKTLANLDSQGKGPEGRFRKGNIVFYNVTNFIRWLEEHSEIVIFLPIILLAISFYTPNLNL